MLDSAFVVVRYAQHNQGVVMGVNMISIYIQQDFYLYDEWRRDLLFLNRIHFGL